MNNLCEYCGTKIWLDWPTTYGNYPIMLKVGSDLDMEISVNDPETGKEISSTYFTPDYCPICGKCLNHISDFANTFGGRLKYALKFSDMSQVELSRKIGKTRQAISSYARDITQPSVGTLRAICIVLGVSSDWLLEPIRQKIEKELKDE